MSASGFPRGCPRDFFEIRNGVKVKSPPCPNWKNQIPTGNEESLLDGLEVFETEKEVKGNPPAPIREIHSMNYGNHCLTFP